MGFLLWDGLLKIWSFLKHSSNILYKWNRKCHILSRLCGSWLSTFSYISNLWITIPDIGLAVRVFANGPGNLGSIPGRVIPKTQKMVLDASLLNTQHYKVQIKGKVEQSREGVAPSPTPWCSSYRKGSLRVTLDYGRQLYLLIRRDAEVISHCLLHGLNSEFVPSVVRLGPIWCLQRLGCCKLVAKSRGGENTCWAGISLLLNIWRD